MAAAAASVHEFLRQVETALAARKLYAPESPPYEEAGQRLLDRCQAAVGGEGFTVALTPDELQMDGQMVYRPSKADASYFFPLYRDGVRRLTFRPGVAGREVEALLQAFEAQERRLLGPSDDTVTLLWRSGLHHIVYDAVDGLGDEEDAGPVDPSQDYRALIAEVNLDLTDPAAEPEERTFNTLLDMDDVRLTPDTLRAISATVKRSFEAQPTIFQLGEDEVGGLRAELRHDDETQLVRRMVGTVLAAMEDPAATVPPAVAVPILAQAVERFWDAGDLRFVLDLLQRLRDAAGNAPRPDSREAARGVLASALAGRRLSSLLGRTGPGGLPFDLLVSLCDAAADGDADPTFEPLFDHWASAPGGELRSVLGQHLRERLASRPALGRALLQSPALPRAKAALAMIEGALEHLYQGELLEMAASHPEESIRMKCVAAAGRMGGAAALGALWRAMESDPAQPVRLLAFRLMETAPPPELPDLLLALTSNPAFGERPAWEREKYLRLLGSVAGESVLELFESWIPQRSFLTWTPADTERAEVVFKGMVACGPAGRARVEQRATARGGLGLAARSALDAWGHRSAR